ncbi:hypothetical protein FQZ97_943710 [compost metagenome]
MRGTRSESMSKSAAKGTLATAAWMRGSWWLCQLALSRRQRITARASASLMGSSTLPRSRVVKPTQEEKSSAMWASQWSRKRAADQRPPARVSAVWPPAEPPYTPTRSSVSQGAKRGLWASASMARETSPGRRCQLVGPGSVNSPVWSP